MEQIGNRTPEKSKCKNPGPPPHQPTFTSAPYCPRQCTCQKRKENNEMHEKIKNWLIKRANSQNGIMGKQQLGEAMMKKDSGIFSPDDDESDKENRP